jgi:hypothetical protein
MIRPGEQPAETAGLHLHDREQVVGIKLGQLRGIDSVGLDGLSTLSGNTGRRHHIAVDTLLFQVPLQREANVGRFINDTNDVPGKLLPNPDKLSQQPLQRGSAFEVEKLPRGFVQRSTVVLRIVDIQADMDYFFVHRRLRFLPCYMASSPRIGTHP